MLDIKKAILHIFDMNSELVIPSGEELDLSADGIFEYIQKHIEKSFKDSSAVASQMDRECSFAKALRGYCEGSVPFKEWSRDMCSLIADQLMLADEQQSVDFIAVDFTLDEEHYVGLMLPNSLTGYTHQIIQEEGSFKNAIIRHYGIMPGVSQKITSFVLVNTNNYHVKYSDKKRMINGENVLIIPDRIISCTQSVSPREAVRRVKAAAEKIADSNGESSVEAVSRAKTFLMENAIKSDDLITEELSRAVFPESKAMAEEFRREIKSSGMPDAVTMDREYAARAGRMHKIKTDTGIELSIPSDFFNDLDHVEFINEQNGTISIFIKNIGSIVNR